ncbi:hypothetical protein OAS67_00885 [Alphaproteobacteria bacterium]|nr:hypothetical protein [Alphaproteobacteria bacterium]
MVAPVEISMGGVELLVDNGLPKQYQVNDRYAVWAACLTALEQWDGGHERSFWKINTCIRWNFLALV